MSPAARYATHGETSIAWTELGEGPIDLVFASGLISHVEHFFEDPDLADWFHRLARFSRVVIIDRRGTGLSDRIAEAPDGELRAAGGARAVLLGYTSGAALGVRFARLHPERTRALVLYAPIASSVRSDDYAFTHDAVGRTGWLEERIAAWGTGALLDTIAPSVAGDPVKRAWLAKMERLSSSPGALRALLAAQVDVRADLPEVRVPTLVLHRSGDRLVSVEHGRWIAERIPGARFVELPGEDNLALASDASLALGEIEEFLTGSRGLTRDRALLTVLFTDVVGSTAHAARLGDDRWASLLSAQDAAVRREVERYGGRAVKSIGDGVLAVFTGAPSKAVVAARAAVGAVGALGLALRAGLHTGECELIGDDVGGMAVHIAARVVALAGPKEVLASGTTYGTVVGSGLEWEDRGMVALRGVHGRWPIFTLRADGA